MEATDASRFGMVLRHHMLLLQFVVSHTTHLPVMGIHSRCSIATYNAYANFKAVEGGLQE